jgi:hypothetical protein
MEKLTEPQYVTPEMQPWEVADYERREKLREGMSKFESMVNTGLGHDKLAHLAVADAFVRFHRTLQQLVVGILVRTILYLADEYSKNPARYTDARNEQSFKWIEKVAEVSKDSYFPYI